MIMVPKSNFKLLKGKEDLSLYQFNLNLAEHFFCKICGIYTHHIRRSVAAMGVNVGCFDHLTIDDLSDIGLVKGSAFSIVNS